MERLCGVKFDLLIGLLLIASNVFAQPASLSVRQADQLYQEADRFFNEQQDSMALAKYQLAKSIYLNNGMVVPNLVKACFGMGIIYQIQEKFLQATEAYKESIAYQKIITPHVDTSNFKAYVLIGSTFIDLSLYDSAYAYYQQAERLLAKYPKIAQPPRFYNEMGYLFDLFGNYTQSINYYEKALKTLDYQPESAREPDKWAIDRYVMYNNNIARSLRKLGHYQESIKKTKGLIKYGLVLDRLYHNLAVTYLQLQQPDSAQLYLSKIDFKTIPPSAQVDYYNTLGSAYSQAKNHQAALFNFEKARHISLAHFSQKNDRLAIAYQGKGQVYEAQGNYTQALVEYQQAISALHFTFNATKVYQNPTDLTNTTSPLLLFDVLRHKANLFRKYFNKTRKNVDLASSLHTYQLAFQLADRIRKSYDSEEAKLFFTNTAAPVYEEAIQTAFQLAAQTGQKGHLETAFALAEQSKAAVLAESVRELEIRQVPGIPESLLRREKELKLNMTALHIRLVEEADSKNNTNYRDQIRDNEIELAKMLKEFEKNKQYHQLKYDTGLVKVSQIQESLDDQTAFLEYFVGKSHLYVFVITQDRFEVKQLCPAAAFTQTWHTLYRALYEAEAGVRYRGDPAAHRLHEQLISPLRTTLAEKKRLVIVPDKELCYLPFEALVADLQAGRYLIQAYSISYAYSGKLLRHSAEVQPKDGKVSILAMAPFAYGMGMKKTALRDEITEPPLYASGDEVTQIGGQVYKDQDATKERFLQQANGYDIVHLATHAKANNTDPLHSFVAFHRQQAPSGSSYRLYAQELYNLRLEKLKLVVLSGCETGGGKLVQGEGIMSLARAFAYAGCPSIVTTLWRAEDRTTAAIATRFHHHLKAGEPKDEALRLAKLDYLDSQKHYRLRSPVYWANFIFIGDTVPVYNTSSIYWWWASGAVLMGVFIFLGVRFYRRRPSRAGLSAKLR